MRFIQEEFERGKRIFVFLGEAGSGKSEIAINWALMLASMNKKVRFFDMDQTKPLFRSRELAEMLLKNGIEIDVRQQFLDAPIIPSGVFDSLRESESVTILDVGGNVAGARSVGQFAQAWGKAAEAYLVVNCYRPFSDTQSKISQTVNSILAASRINSVSFINNPNFGERTTLNDIAEGYKITKAMLQGLQCHSDLLVVQRRLEEMARDILPGVKVLGINRYIKVLCDTSKHELGQEEG